MPAGGCAKSMNFQANKRQDSERPVIWIEELNAKARQQTVDALGDSFAFPTEPSASPTASQQPELVICGVPKDADVARFRIERLREQRQLGGVPLLLLVSELNEASCRLISECDFDDFVVMPVSNSELSIRARKLLATKHARTQPRTQQSAVQAAQPERRAKAAADNEHFRLIVDSIEDYAIFMLSPEGRVTTWNRGAENLTGYTAKQALGRPLSSLYLPAHWRSTQLREELDLVRRAKRYEDIGLHKRRDGSTYSAQTIIRRVDDGSGALLGFVTVIRDVTERKRAEKALKESEAKFRTIADAMPQMVWSTRPDGYHDYYNERWYQYTGMPRGSTDGDGWNGMFHPDDQGRAWALWSHSLATGEPYEIEYRVRHHSGDYRWTLGRALPIRDDDGRIVRWMGTCTVIHAQKEAEAALQEASRRKDEFLAMLAHELRNPLAPLRNSMALMRHAGLPSSEKHSALDVAERQVRHMSRLVNDLLDVARISRGKMQLREENCELNDIVRQSADDYRSSFESSGIELGLNCLSDPLWMRGDCTRIAQVIGNLLHNASKFTRSGGRVQLRTGRRILPEGEHAEVVVQDSGVGIDPALSLQLFDPFVQADQDLGRADGGLGLGLAVVKGFMELHKGKVEARSDGAGQGTTFTLHFPLNGEAIPSASRQQATTGDTAEHACKRRIVLVEDNKDMLATLEALLHLEGHEVVAARDGPSGFEAVTATQPDLVICDIGLPGSMDGYALARAIRASERISQVLLVALSGYSQGSESRDSGFDRHLLKPLDIDELRHLLASIK